MSDLQDIQESAEKVCKQTTSNVENFVREQPGTAILAAIGIGCVVGLVTRALLSSPPPPPRHRAMRILEDIQSRLSDLVEPTYERASDLASEGSDAVRRGMDQLHDLHLGNRIKKFFS